MFQKTANKIKLKINLFKFQNKKIRKIKKIHQKLLMLET
jgi:hypothetical protein